jgi:hypothetical protein
VLSFDDRWKTKERKRAGNVGLPLPGDIAMNLP